MKVIVAGSRTIHDHALVEKAIKDSGFLVTEVVSGGAAGVDTSGVIISKKLGVPVRFFEPNWNLGLKAGPIRNKLMAEYADALILVWDGNSKGSASMRREMLALNKPIYELVL